MLDKRTIICTACAGTGESSKRIGGSRHSEPSYKVVTCPLCLGDGELIVFPAGHVEICGETTGEITLRKKGRNNRGNNVKEKRMKHQWESPTYVTLRVEHEQYCECKVKDFFRCERCEKPYGPCLKSKNVSNLCKKCRLEIKGGKE